MFSGGKLLVEGILSFSKQRDSNSPNNFVFKLTENILRPITVIPLSEKSLF